MNTSILKYDGLFGDDVLSIDSSIIHHEPLEKRSLLYNYEITEHLHTDLFQIFLMTSGRGLLISSGVKIPIESPCVLIIPSNRLHGFVFQSEVKGDVFTIPDPLYEKIVKKKTMLFLEYNQIQYFSLAPDCHRYSELLSFKQKIIKELRQTDNMSGLTLSLLIQLLFVTLYRCKQTQEVATVKTDDKALNYFIQFKELIKRFIHERRQVRFYAQEMRLSTVHLNRICQLVSQETALQVIHRHIMKEAKKYLTGTSYSVAEIAFFLGFKDPAHFSKFFKKKEGITPGSFRKND